MFDVCSNRGPNINWETHIPNWGLGTIGPRWPWPWGNPMPLKLSNLRAALEKLTDKHKPHGLH